MCGFSWFWRLWIVKALKGQTELLRIATACSLWDEISNCIIRNELLILTQRRILQTRENCKASEENILKSSRLTSYDQTKRVGCRYVRRWRIKSQDKSREFLYDWNGPELVTWRALMLMFVDGSGGKKLSEVHPRTGHEGPERE
jgi:hypothetical protein